MKVEVLFYRILSVTWTLVFWFQTQEQTMDVLHFVLGNRDTWNKRYNDLIIMDNIENPNNIFIDSIIYNFRKY